MRPATEALIVIDVQNDFCPGGALAVTGGDEIVQRINLLLPQFRVNVLTQDWHPANHSSFACNHLGAAPFTLMEMAYGPQMLWPVHCVQGSPGAAFHADLQTNPVDLVLRKGFHAAVDSYSAFYENDHVTPTGLDGYLRARGVTSVTLVGLALDYCVAYSALDAARLGFAVTVMQDACRAIDPGEGLARMQALMVDAGIRLEA